MNDGIDSLQAAIAAHLAEWEQPFVEIAIHGTDDAGVIARSIDSFCLRQLGSGAAGALFYRSSVGAAAGIALADGRQVVVKAHQHRHSAAHLRDVVKLQRHLAAGGSWAPDVLAGPSPLGSGLATVEEYRAQGSVRDGHEPVVRRALAVGFHRVIYTLEAFIDAVNLRCDDLPAHSLWPTPHSQLFDFDSTTQGADYIDDLAREARRRMAPAGRRVISHQDWRAEHVRFDGDAISVVYDWDSLRVAFEPAAVGATAHMFCADWTRSDHAQAPTLDEARAFVGDYEAARGSPFTSEERRACGAAFTYAVAYTARCGHACGVDIRHEPGNHQHLVERHGAALLDL